MNRSKVGRLEDAIRAHVEPGMHLNFASTPSRSNAAARELARAFRGGDPKFEISATGFHSLLHLLPMLRLGRKYVACFVGDNYPVPRPNPLYTLLREEGAEVELWSLWSYVSALRAGALGLPYAMTRSLVGTDMATDLARAGRFRPLEALAGSAGGPLGLVSALVPDITFVHAPVADESGALFFVPPYSEGLWGAHAARRGVVATAERILTSKEASLLRDTVRFPAHRVLAVAEEPFGAHPQPLHGSPRLGFAGYVDDFPHYELWRGLSSQSRAEPFTAPFLDAADGGRAYRAWVGEDRLAELALDASSLTEAVQRARTAGTAPAPRRPSEHPSQRDENAGRIPPLGPHASHNSARSDAPARANEILVTLAARKIEERVRAVGYPVILAGIGHSFLAARIAKQRLAEAGIVVHVLVETGLFDVECGGAGDEFLLSYRNMALAGSLSSVEDALGTLTCGATTPCLGVLGAAQVDATGALNSTQIGKKILVGSGGANDIASSAAEVIVLARCEPKRLVPRVDYVTSPGHAVRNVVTDMCVFTREDGESSSWGVADVYPVLGGRAPSFVVEAIRQSCSWSLRLPPDAEYAPLISTAEMALIHALDPEGVHWRRGTPRLG